MYRRQLRDISNPFGVPESRFVKLFRFTRDAARFLIQTLSPYLVRHRRKSGISVDIRTLVALRYFATGDYQRSVGEDFHFGLSQTSTHRCIHEITRAICQHMADDYIIFPQTVPERNRIRVNFMNRFGFPGVVGCIDGTHIAILKPSTDEHNYLNRKGLHSLNVQIICDSNLKIINLNPNFGGASHDAFIWRNSGVQTYLQQLHGNGEICHLLGDSGYPLQPYLLTPVLNAQPNTPESNYNKAHVTARNTVERTIGQLKMRFRCVLKERTARFVADLVTACAVLHNLCIDRQVPVMPLNGIPAEVNDNGVNYENDIARNLGRAARDNIIARYFQ